jgi:Helix-turn-helix.
VNPKGNVDMTVFERIKILASKQGKSLNKVEEELGLSKNVLYRMKDSDNPTKERLETLADYFKVSVDYLLGRTEEPNAAADQPSMAKQVMMRMDTDGATEEELEELESEMERFFAWRLEEIKRERGEN